LSWARAKIADRPSRTPGQQEEVRLSKNEAVIRKVRAVLDDAYEEAAYMVVAHVQETGASLQGFCKDVCVGTPYSWQALRARAQRIEQKARGGAESMRAISRAGALRGAKSALRNADPEAIEKLVSDLPDEAVENLAVAASESVRERQAPRVSRQANSLDGISAEVEILTHLHKAVKAAQKHGKEKFLVKRLHTVIERVEMELAAASPQDAVADLEQWLAGQVT
jgi:hypothetical protein